MSTHINTHSSGMLLILFGADELWANVLVRKCIRTERKPSPVSTLYLVQKGRGKRNTKVNRASAIKRRLKLTQCRENVLFLPCLLMDCYFI